MSKRLASSILAYGLLAGLIAPAGLVAQERQAGGPPPQQLGPATQPQEPPIAPQAQPAPPQPAQPQAGDQPAPAPPAEPAAPKPAHPRAVAVAASPGSVTMKNIAFSPASLTVDVGETVTWNNADQVAHNATANDGSFATGTIKAGASGSHTFTRAGTFGYVCTIHPGMDGTVRVVASSSGGGNGGSSGGGGSGSQRKTSAGAGSSAPSGSSAGAGSGGNLPATGVDAGGLAIWGLGFLLIGLFARRRTT